MKNLLIFAMLILTLSCQSQGQKDLLSLKFGQDIGSFLKEDQSLKTDQDVNLGLYGLTTNQQKGYAIGKVKLSPYTFPNGNAADYSDLQLFTDSKDKTTYLGFRYNSVNQEESKKILEELKATYPKFEQRNANGNGEAYFWDLAKLDAWLFVSQAVSSDKNDKNFFNTQFIFVKKGTRVENSKDASYNTIYDNFNMMYPTK